MLAKYSVTKIGPRPPAAKVGKKLTTIIALGYGKAQCAPHHILAPRRNQFYTMPIVPRY